VRYGLFARFYDASLERLYREARISAATALDIQPGHALLDVPCGTGQSLDLLVDAVGAQGRVVGVDLDAAMLRKAQHRIESHGWQNVEVIEGDASALDTTRIAPAPFDRLHVFLGMSVFADPERTFEQLWSLLRPGGRCVIVDVFAERLGLQGRLVNLTAGADIRRRSWEPLEARCITFERQDLASKWQHGGTLFLACGNKPG
jgi:demethylmenaquinone methyltransferase/2-methoxy-6-polyprenyl-1,4-benzoquinol methylase